MIQFQYKLCGRFAPPVGVLFALLLGFSFAAIPTMAQGQTATPPEATVTSGPGAGDSTALEKIELAMSLVTPEPGSGTARINIFLERADTEWPSVLHLRLTYDQGVTVQQAEFDGETVNLEAANATSQTFALDVSAQEGQQVRQLAVTLILWPGSQQQPVGIQAELLDATGEPVTRVALPADEQQALALGRPAATPTAEENDLIAQQASQPAERATEPPPEPAAPDMEATRSMGAISQQGEDEQGLNRILLLVGGGVLLLIALILAALVLFRVSRRRRTMPASKGTGPALKPAPTRESKSAGAYLALAGEARRRFPIDAERFTIGRASTNHLSLDEAFGNNDTVSHHHAVIYQQDGEYVIEDLNSRNGVWVNGRATPKNVLQNGWEITVGEVTFTFNEE